MNAESTILTLGIGTAGCAMMRGIGRACGGGLRYTLIDTDASSDNGDESFILLGGERLSGRGAGGHIVDAPAAAEDSIGVLDEHLEGVRLAVLVTALGGGTGSGATCEIVRHLSGRGIPTVVFASTPFSFEGPDRKRNAVGMMSMIEESANATFFLPLDKLVRGEDNFEAALRRAIDTMASAVTLFWRLIAKPGYVRLDAERLRHLLGAAGKGRFATVTLQGADRDLHAVDELTRSELLTAGDGPVRAIVCGVLAGEDLRLTEIDRIAKGVRKAFGGSTPCTFDLGTVNDEETFSGRLSVVLLLFENAAQPAGSPSATPLRGGRNKRPHTTLTQGPAGRGRFDKVEATIYEGEDLDVPTFIRRNVSLDF